MGRGFGPSPFYFMGNFWQEYRQFMFSPEWKQIRLKVFRKYGKRCDCCRAVGQIQVHHLSYSNWRNPDLNDLRPACYHCHAALKAEQTKTGLKGHALWAWHKKNCTRNRRR